VRVPNDGETGQLDFTNAMRSHGNWSSIYKQAAEEGTVRMTLGNGNVSDETVVHFNSDAQNGFDDHDSHKFWAAASVPQLYTTTGTDSLVINGLESVATNPVVDLGVKLPTQGDYTLTATDITLADEVWLEDRLLNIFQDLNLNATYDFTDEAGNIPTRFALHFGMMAVGVGGGDDAFRAQVFSSGNEVHIILSEEVHGTATVYDMAGRIITTEQLLSTRNSFGLNTATGIYVVKLETEKGVETHRVMLK